VRPERVDTIPRVCESELLGPRASMAGKDRRSGKLSQETGVVKQWKQDGMEPLLRVSRFVDSRFSSEAGEECDAGTKEEEACQAQRRRRRNWDAGSCRG
jgi:hypothetical protein